MTSQASRAAPPERGSTYELSSYTFSLPYQGHRGVRLRLRLERGGLESAGAWRPRCRRPTVSPIGIRLPDRTVSVAPGRHAG